MTCVFPSVTDGHLSSEKPYPATRFDLGIRLPRKTPPDYMADTLNRILKTLESITDIRTAVKNQDGSIQEVRCSLPMACPSLRGKLKSDVVR